MANRLARPVALVATAATAALGAYAIGTQQDDGTATAKSSGSGSSSEQQRWSHHHRGEPFGDLSALAADLGVSEAQLRAALEDLRPDEPCGRPDRDQDGPERFAKALADKLGLPVDEVTRALEDNAPPMGARHGHGGPGMGGPMGGPPHP